MITINKVLLSKIEEHAKAQRPNEACGVLAGRGGGVEKTYRCKNASKNPLSRYKIAPEELLEIFNDTAKNGLEILGFYHSHPSGLDTPSNIDCAEAMWHAHSYVILHASGVSSWVWNEEQGQFAREEVEIAQAGENTTRNGKY